MQTCRPLSPRHMFTFVRKSEPSIGRSNHLASCSRMRFPLPSLVDLISKSSLFSWQMLLWLETEFTTQSACRHSISGCCCLNEVTRQSALPRPLESSILTGCSSVDDFFQSSDIRETASTLPNMFPKSSRSSGAISPDAGQALRLKPATYPSYSDSPSCATMTSGVLPVSWDVAAIIFTALVYGFFVVRRRYRVLRYPRSKVPASSREGKDVSASRTKLARSAEKDADSDPNKCRKFGEWMPVQFTYPAITPVAQQLQDMPPRPYRPFKAGGYHVTMGIRNMVWDDWIELDNQFEKFHRVRSARIRERGAQLVRVLPDDRPGLVHGGAEAAAELAQELAEFLVRRYPDVYRVERATGAGDGWDGLGRVTKVTVVPVGETYDLEREDPMRVAALLVQDDLAIMIEGTDGNYYLQAGAIVIPGSWRISDKIGMPLDEIHFTGEVPSYKEKLQPSLTRFFRRMTPTRPVVRENWLIQVLDPARLARADADPDELAWSTTMYGAEDTFAHPPSSYALSQSSTSQASSTGAPLPSPPPTPPRALPPATPATLRLRTERQSLRRLPRTGAVVFTVRTYSTPLADLGAEPGVPGRLASAMRGMSAESARRRRQDAFEGPLLAFLDECHRGQVERGEVPAEEA